MIKALVLTGDDCMIEAKTKLAAVASDPEQFFSYSLLRDISCESRMKHKQKSIWYAYGPN
ncbi:hypothetical protein DPMN_159400 [Dreissena polymorpha]|uniref:Uncharacterized protein n=1 Tax=Dreissena polymorpha TaxID=45954 RepID=A0A9D4EJ18_DREPO|nr:hypothetical protein DPMN_159400 [Dreissena polymorpha]